MNMSDCFHCEGTELCSCIVCRVDDRPGECVACLQKLDARPHNAKKQNDGSVELFSRTQAARAAGLSIDQQKQAMRVASERTVVPTPKRKPLTLDLLRKTS
jgi:hypothetical protein